VKEHGMSSEDEKSACSSALKHQELDTARTVSPKYHAKVMSGPSDTEQWYLRIDNKKFGPVSRSEMEFFLRPPRLCRIIQVMCTVREGYWYSIAQHETVDNVLLQFGLNDLRKEAASVQSFPPSTPSSLANRGSDFRRSCKFAYAGILNYRVPLVVALTAVVLNAGFLVVFSSSLGRDREILNRYEAIWKVACELNSIKASNDDWKDFTDKSNVQLESLLDELLRTASVHDPVRQNLLYGGRDHLAKILRQESPKAVDSYDGRLFEKRLNIARQQVPIQ
jgi:hypothetical protein